MKHSLQFGFLATHDILDVVNQKRQGQSYIDEQAVAVKFGSVTKKTLIFRLFASELEYGYNCDGHCTYEPMAIQHKDLIIILRHNHPDFDFIFLLNHLMNTTNYNLRASVLAK